MDKWLKDVEDHAGGFEHAMPGTGIIISTEIALARMESHDHIWLPARQEDAQSSCVPRK